MMFSNRHQKSYCLSLIILMALISSCAQATAISTQPITLVVPSATPPAAVITPIDPTQEYISTRTSQPAEEIRLEEQCVKIEEELPSDLHLSGVWIRQNGKPYLENLEDHTRYGVPLAGGEALSHMAISPDRKLLAYFDGYINPNSGDTDRWEFRILRSNGYLIVLKNWIFDVRQILGWANNSEIVLKVYSKGLKYIVYNPSSGESHEIIIDHNVVSPPYMWELITQFRGDSFNPSRIFFLTDAGNFLYSVQTWQKIFDIDIGYFGTYSWSSDLSTVIISPLGDRNIYVAKNDNIFLKLNSVESGLSANNDPIDAYEWSPDNKKFIVKSAYTFESPSKLAIMNLDGFKLKRICIKDDSIFDDGYMYSYVWSPDSRFLILYYDQQDWRKGIEHFDLLIDTENMRAFRLQTSGYSPNRIGWLASP
jgi:hypothetical protein